MRNIILIRPDIDNGYPFGKLPPYVPLGLGFIAGVLKEKGFKVRIIDCYLHKYADAEILDIVEKSDPLFVGISVNVASTQNTYSLTNLLTDKGEYVVLGGPQITVAPEKTLLESGADLAVIGEGEETILEIADKLQTGCKNMLSVKGVVFSDNERVVRTDVREKIKNLDKLPFIPLELFPYEQYSKGIPEMSAKPLMWLNTSRGCPWNCSFCSNIYVWGNEYRTMGAERVVREMIRLKKDFGINAIQFREDNFTVDRKRVLEICDLIVKNDLKMEWMCESRVDTVDDSILAVMKKAGNTAIYFGVESGTQRVIDFLNKKINLKQIETAVALCKKHGIKSIVSVMLGIPGQTMEENAETLAFLKRIKPEIVYFNPFIGIPGSMLYNEIVKKDLIYKKCGDLILANSECMTWKEKVRLKQRYEVSYNLAPDILINHIVRIGWIRFFEKVIITLKRYFCLNKSA